MKKELTIFLEALFSCQIRDLEIFDASRPFWYNELVQTFLHFALIRRTT